jgi:AraC-like DNA-binding protein
MKLTHDLQALADLALQHFPDKSDKLAHSVEPVPGLKLLRCPVKTSFKASVYEPVVCLIVQGKKETLLGGRQLTADTGACLLVSHDLPVLSRVVRAPYLALLLDVELALLRGLYEELADTLLNSESGRALEVHAAGPHLLDAFQRYLALAGSPADAKVLGPLIRRELHYRLLTAPFGGMLRSLVRHDSHESAIARAIAQIRQDYRGELTIPALAKRVGMSTSSFHKHFKAVTDVSPLQYQKDLRLLDARRLLTEGATVSDAAFGVGYESLSQFSREYARKFGIQPRKEHAKLAG